MHHKIIASRKPSKLVSSPEWQDLIAHAEEMKKFHIRDLFAQDPFHAEKFTLENEDFLVDMSKNLMIEDTRNYLLTLAYKRNLKEEIEAMFTGEKINKTEDRAVLHTALRNLTNRPVLVDGTDIMPLVFKELDKAHAFCQKVHSGEWVGHTGKRIKNIVNIGIGGSDLGPYMTTEALKHYAIKDINSVFVSNVDDADIQEKVLNVLDPEETLFLLASKTFTTQETMRNALTAKNWVLKRMNDDTESVKKHFVALSTNKEKVSAFGIDTANMFEFWDWVGGRYSSWAGAIGLSIALNIGFDNFIKFLGGAQEMDEHFRHTPFERNIPVMLALVGIWNNNFLDITVHGLLPYSQYLHRLPAYFQQGDMESNGKSVDRDGNPIWDYRTGPVIFGEAGTNGQHAFYQEMHQGTSIMSADFIGFINPLNHNPEHHDMLMSNMFAQTNAFAFGKDEATVVQELIKKGESEERINMLRTHKVFNGNRPTNTILIDKLTPRSFGKLIAMYEHKIFTQGIIWNIFSFDQWGVELGKEVAGKIYPDLTAEQFSGDKYDSSTNSLINRYRSRRNRP